MIQAIILIFAVAVPVAIAVLMLRAWKKYDRTDYEYPEQYKEEDKPKN